MASFALCLAAYLVPGACAYLALTAGPVRGPAVCAAALVAAVGCPGVRAAVLPLAAWLTGSLLFLVVLGAARWAGGTPPAELVAPLAHVAAVWAGLSAAAVLARGLLTPAHHLYFLDALRAPRTVQYLVVAAVAALPRFGDDLRWQVRQARLRTNRAVGRVRLYARVTVPLFLASLEGEEVRALSLGTRGFFTRPERFAAPPFAAPRAAAIVLAAGAAVAAWALVNP